MSSVQLNFFGLIYFFSVYFPLIQMILRNLFKLNDIQFPFHFYIQFYLPSFDFAVNS